MDLVRLVFFATGLYKDGRSGCPAPILADPDLSALFPTFNHLFSYNLVLITHYLDHEEGRYICSSPCLVPNETGRNLFTLLFTLNLPPSLGFLSLFLPSPSSINPLAHLSSRITNEYLIVMSFQAMANLATVLLALPVALFPAVAQAEALAALGCRAHTWDTPARPREGPTIPDAVYFQAVNMTDFAAELKAAGWSQLALGSTNFIYDHASGAFDEKAPSIFWSTPGKPLQGMPHQNQKFCRYEWNQNWVSFRRKDAMAQIDRFCGSGSPLYGKAIKGPLTAVLRIPTPPQDTKYHDDRAHPIDMGWYWLEWVLYVEDGCEWMHDEADCLSYMHGALDGCGCDDASEKWGGAVVNRCYGFGLWMGPSFFDLHACPEQVRGAETWALEDCTRTWAG